MRFPGAVLTSAAAVALAATAAPPAPAAWSPPARVGPPAAGLSLPSLAFSGDGRGLVTGSFELGYVGADTSLPSTRLATIAPGTDEGGVIGDYETEIRPVATSGTREAITLSRVATGARDGDFNARVQLGATIGTTAAPLRGKQALDSYVDAGGLDLAANARGDAAAIWTELRRIDRDTLRIDIATRIAVRRAGGRFGKARTLLVRREFAGGGDVGEAVAVTPSGRVLVAFSRDAGEGRRRVREMRIATLDGRRGRLGRSQRLGPQLGGVAVELEVAPTGRTVVAWHTQDTGEEANLPLQVWASTRAPGAAKFARPQRLESGGGIARGGGFALGVGPDGAAVVTWAAPRRGTYPFTYPVEAASAAPAGAFAKPVVLAPNGIAGDAAVGPDGRAVITWTSAERGNEQDGLQVLAATRSTASTPFGVAQAVSPVERAEDPVAAYDPLTGQPVVAWSGAPGSPPGTDADGDTADRVLSFARLRP